MLDVAPSPNEADAYAPLNPPRTGSLTPEARAAAEAAIARSRACPATPESKRQDHVRHRDSALGRILRAPVTVRSRRATAGEQRGSVDRECTRFYFDASLSNRAWRFLTRCCASSFSGSSLAAWIAAVEGFSLPPDHGCIVLAIGVFRLLDIAFAQKHVGGGLIRIRSREPLGQRE